ncbi:hypothetical protein [Vibrio ezurae]|uniref:Uncharacterized protein n=1 Tax=Vibrio ezurae NBRC 102218 TaxID=1219080 RepID=U3AXC4_9VIBR|nr:hypothetical protein [Vibrio ezurae]GAD78395.1 hypothetical protein VEZ01S_01_01740 [Vibrio ezurae NBRC 102218]
MNSNKGYVLLMVLTLLFVLGFLALDNARYLANAISSQSYMYQKRARLDWQLESMLNCVAVYLSSMQPPSTDDCPKAPEIQVLIEPLSQRNQFQIQVSKNSVATSAVMQLGEREQDYAMISNIAVSHSYSTTSSLVDPAGLLSFYGYDSIESLQHRWGSVLEVASKPTCGDELLARLQQSQRDVVIKGSCAVSAQQWQQMTNISQLTPVNLLFIGSSFDLSVSSTLQGVLAIWQTESVDMQVNITGSLSIDGGLHLHLLQVIEASEPGWVIRENTQRLQEARFKFAKRSWRVGSWRDF